MFYDEFIIPYKALYRNRKRESKGSRFPLNKMLAIFFKILYPLQIKAYRRLWLLSHFIKTSVVCIIPIK